MNSASFLNIGQGTTIDSYTIQKQLGEGSFGKVFYVTDPRGFPFALKLLKLWEVPEEISRALVSRFDMEFETGLIESPYLVHTLSHGIVGGNPYIVMEYCPGGDLLTKWDQVRYDLPRVALHVLSGLKALHRCGKVHRDLKPENVLIKADGDYALTDFGIAGDRNKRMTERSVMGRPKQILGTYAYMPPEQLNPSRDATVLPTTDIFSFGVMMYQLMTGRLPFGQLNSERDLISYTQRGLQGDWDRQSLLDSKDGQRWMPLIAGCLESDYKQRLQTADDAKQKVPASEEEFRENRQNSAKPPFDTVPRNGLLLRVMQGVDHGREYRLNDLLHSGCAVLSMGRKDFGVANDIEINEQGSTYVSRLHCTFELEREPAMWIVRDGQWDKSRSGGWRRSTNGTYVNSREATVEGLPFTPGDIISVGDTKLRVEAY